MIQKTFLFIGGSKDGEIIALEDPKHVMLFPVRLPMTPSLEPDEPVKHEHHRYYLERLRGETVYYLYRYEGLAVDDVMERLLNNYRPSITKI